MFPTILFNYPSNMLAIIFLYLDPGTGSLLFQALISGFLTIMIFFKKIVAFFKLKFLRREKSSEDVD